MAVPNPRTWANGEDTASIPFAADLNLDLRDTLRFLINASAAAPGFHGWSTSLTAVNNATWTAVPINQELEKSGGVTHSNVTNNTRITVPETGWYRGIAQVTWNSTAGGIAGRFSLDIRVNGTTFQNVRADNLAHLTDIDYAPPSAPFRVWLTATQYVELMARQETGNNLWAMWGSTIELSPSIGLWYDSKQA